MPNEYVGEFEGKPLYRATLSNEEIYGAVISKLLTGNAQKIAELEVENDRLAILAIKHCPNNHHDWPAVIHATKRFDAKMEKDDE